MPTDFVYSRETDIQVAGRACPWISEVGRLGLDAEAGVAMRSKHHTWLCQAQLQTPHHRVKGTLCPVGLLVFPLPCFERTHTKGEISAKNDVPGEASRLNSMVNPHIAINSATGKWNRIVKRTNPNCQEQCDTSSKIQPRLDAIRQRFCDRVTQLGAFSEWLGGMQTKTS